MGHYLSIPILALAVVLQSTFVPQIRIYGGQPDLPFLLVLAWSINSRLEESVTWAFVGGVMSDLLSAAPLGASTAGMLLIVFTIEWIQNQVFRIGLFTLLGVVLAGTLVQKLVFIVVVAVAGFPVRPFELLTYVVLPTVAYNLIFIFPIYWFVRRIQRRFIKVGRITTQS
jgi:rod shape-determining protein MreD